MSKTTTHSRQDVDWVALFDEGLALDFILGRPAAAFQAPFTKDQQCLVVILPIEAETMDQIKAGTWSLGTFLRAVVPKVARLLGEKGSGG